MMHHFYSILKAHFFPIYPNFAFYACKIKFVLHQLKVAVTHYILFFFINFEILYTAFDNFALVLHTSLSAIKHGACFILSLSLNIIKIIAFLNKIAYF